MGHGIAGIQGKIEDDLRHLCRTHTHLPEIGCEIADQLNVLSDQPPQEILQATDHFVPRKGQRLGGVLARNFHQLLDQRRGLFAGAAHLLDVAQVDSRRSVTAGRRRSQYSRMPVKRLLKS